MKLEQLLLGSMLGDGCIPTKDKAAKHHRFSMAHSLKQECYFHYKYDLLTQYNLTTSYSNRKIENPRYKQGFYEEVRTKTKGNIIFDTYRQLFYPEGKKIIPNEIEKLEDEGLAIWFMDDGYRTGRDCKGAAFSTEGFSLEEREKLAQLLRDKWNLKCSIHKTGIIYIHVQSVPKLIEIVSPFIPPCMKYKVLNKSGELQESSGEPICSQAIDASIEGSQTTGGIGSLNNQHERPTLKRVMT
mgnify:CR=1 FL=1